jgi:hypothetical protein
LEVCARACDGENVAFEEFEECVHKQLQDSSLKKKKLKKDKPKIQILERKKTNAGISCFYWDEENQAEYQFARSILVHKGYREEVKNLTENVRNRRKEKNDQQNEENEEELEAEEEEDDNAEEESEAEGESDLVELLELVLIELVELIELMFLQPVQLIELMFLQPVQLLELVLYLSPNK